MLILYDYIRSSAAYRVRIALHLKDIEYEKREVHLLNNGGEQHHAEYHDLNPQELVPTLIDGNTVLTQSLAIIEYLNVKFPTPNLLLGDAAQQAKIRAIANIIACDMHPINNLRVLQYLQRELAVTDEQKQTWYAHWLELGFNAIEAQIDRKGPYCFGTSVTLADIFLIPQVYNAHRFNCDMSAFPNINRVYAACNQLAAFQQAAPQAQQ